MHQQDADTQESGSSMEKRAQLAPPRQATLLELYLRSMNYPEKEHIPDTHVTWSTHGSRYDGRPDLHTFNSNGYDVSERL